MKNRTRVRAKLGACIAVLLVVWIGTYVVASLPQKDMDCVVGLQKEWCKGRGEVWVSRWVDTFTCIDEDRQVKEYKWLEEEGSSCFYMPESWMAFAAGAALALVVSVYVALILFKDEVGG